MTCTAKSTLYTRFIKKWGDGQLVPGSKHYEQWRKERKAATIAIATSQRRQVYGVTGAR